MYTEPTCGYMEAGCGAPFVDSVGYGPVLGGCSTCGSGGCDGGCCEGGVVTEGTVIEGGTVTAPAPESYTDPAPTE
jgi:hypothetical protein